MQVKKKIVFKVVVGLILQMFICAQPAIASWLNRDVAKQYLQQRYGENNSQANQSLQNNKQIQSINISQPLKGKNLPNLKSVIDSIIPLLNKSAARTNTDEAVKNETVTGLNMTGSDIKTKVNVLKELDYSKSEAAVALISTKGGKHSPAEVSKALVEAGYDKKQVDRYLGDIVKRLEQIQKTDIKVVDKNKQPPQIEQKVQQQDNTVDSAQKLHKPQKSKDIFQEQK